MIKTLVDTNRILKNGWFTLAAVLASLDDIGSE